MAKNLGGKSKGKPVAVVVGATSKWQADGRNTQADPCKAVDDSDLPVGIRWASAAPLPRSSRARGSLSC